MRKHRKCASKIGSAHISNPGHRGCESVTSGARSLRETYERQRAVVLHALLSSGLYEPEEEVDEDEEEGAGFIGTIFY
uniref:Uncharacterized protein n=1 Tax=Caenorhabditis japonica TaxID=281687 RepID=A0A8R1IC18_CAEJA